MSALSYPPSTPWQPFEQARERIERLTRDLATAVEAHDKLLAARNEAVEADRQALAAAIREDRARPKEGAAVAKVDAQIAAALREREGFELALREEHAAFSALLDENREKWLAEIDEKLNPKVKAAALRALEAFAGARAELGELFALRAYVASTSERRRYKANVQTRIPALRKASGDAYSVEEAVDCLREGLVEPGEASDEARVVGW